MARKTNYAFDRDSRAKAKAAKREAKRQAKLNARAGKQGGADSRQAGEENSDAAEPVESAEEERNDGTIPPE